MALPFLLSVLHFLSQFQWHLSLHIVSNRLVLCKMRKKHYLKWNRKYCLFIYTLYMMESV